MIRLIAVAGFALAVATSAQAMSPAPLHQPDGMTTQVAFGCGAGRTRVGWCLRGQNHQTPSPQVRGVGCRERLPSVVLRRHRTGDRDSTSGDYRHIAPAACPLWVKSNSGHRGIHSITPLRACALQKNGTQEAKPCG